MTQIGSSGCKTRSPSGECYSASQFRFFPLQCYIREQRIFGKTFPLYFLCSLLFKIFGYGSAALLLSGFAALR
jgi:hypothetical protein